MILPKKAFKKKKNKYLRSFRESKKNKLKLDTLKKISKERSLNKLIKNKSNNKFNKSSKKYTKSGKLSNLIAIVNENFSNHI